jgi:hypothetical protein
MLQEVQVDESEQNFTQVSFVFKGLQKVNKTIP